MSKAMEKYYGKVIKSVEFNLSRDEMALNFEDGTQAHFYLDAECCSSSYFTDDCIKDAQDLVGGELLCLEEVSSNDLRPDRKYPDCDDQTESISWHFAHVITNKTQVTLDWRNDSNGCYEGKLILTDDNGNALRYWAEGN